MKLIKNLKKEYEHRGVLSAIVEKCHYNNQKVGNGRDHFTIDEQWYFDWSNTTTLKEKKAK